MFGKTNSFAASSGGKGCDVVYAANNTGEEITAGSKVWLNQHILGVNNNARLSWNNRYSMNHIVFNLNNRLFGNNSTTLRRVVYRAETDTWGSFDTCPFPNDGISSVYYKDGIVWMYKYSGDSYIIKKSGEQMAVAGCILSANKIFTRSTSKLTTYNSETGVIDTSGGASLPSFNESGSFLHLDGDLLFYQRYSLGNYVYDVSDYAAPVLLASPKFSVSNAYVRYMTGVSAGNYIFVDVSNFKEFECGTFYLYKITSGYAVELAADVPEKLRNLMGRKCRFSYNNKTGVFIIGTATQLFFYKFEDGEFHEFEVKFGNMPGCKSDSAYMARLTDDMSSIGITAKTSSGSYTYNVTNVYRLQVMDDTWYAEDFAAASSLSLAGYATGAKNNEGLYEVKTLLPEVCRYNLTVTPTPDIIEFKGEAL